MAWCEAQSIDRVICQHATLSQQHILACSEAMIINPCFTLFLFLLRKQFEASASKGMRHQNKRDDDEHAMLMMTLQVWGDGANTPKPGGSSEKLEHFLLERHA